MKTFRGCGGVTSVEALEPRRLFAAATLSAIDPTYGDEGRLVLDAPAAQEDFAGDVVVDKLGRTLVAGRTAAADQSTAAPYVAVFRYLPDGSPDPSFGDGGRVLLTGAVETYDPGSEAIALDRRGRIVVAFQGLSLARLNADG